MEKYPADCSKRDELVVRHLLQCCCQSTIRQATDPKDYVYGYAALFDSAIVPDYSAAKTTASTYCDLAEKILLLSGNTIVAFLDYAGLGYAWDIPSGLPSWAPNLSGTSGTHFETEACPRSALYRPPPTIVRATA
ncbi:hypothetical protein P280DRAFT_302439 [Massarina eburnea CBS 473.64]|uniref:Uncharacterized protein n=1 Tax=Massarina eburnea CBS 473.64 TaxID=1395130 RepID=A0A6A6S176_9PLEO|nr:hypothetical protein P280DRAFT_302439 [Massarina eburnea CBS 473.64]